MRYIVERLPGTLSYRVFDTLTATTVVRLERGEALLTVFEDRVDANRVAANLNRAEAERKREG